MDNPGLRKVSEYYDNKHNILKKAVDIENKLQTERSK